ncbi:MAG TPA: hypothetical protein VML96_01225 [Egibacteraceae bacterium]|nr:hypothetical protein [Egibacteraceae bacterium]
MALGRQTAKGTPTCVWRVNRELLETLDEKLGPPLDSYVRGWQVWLEANGPDGATLEWRLHPPAGFTMPRGVNHHDLFDVVLQQLALLGEGEPIAFDDRARALSEIWEVLEAFPAYGDDSDPQALAAACADALGGRQPDGAGRVDHRRLGDLWKGRRGEFSVGRALLDQVGAPRD